MKKFIYSFLIVAFLLLPTKVFAAGYINPSTNSLSIQQGSTASFNIVAFNAIGDVTIASNNPGIASVSSGSWSTGMVGDGQTLSGTVVVTGVGVGSTQIVLTVDGANFEGQSVSGTRVINVTVTEKPAVVPPAPSNPVPNTPSAPSAPVDTRSNNTNLSSVKVNGKALTNTNGQFVLDVSNHVANIDIIASAEDSKSKVTGTGKKDIAVGNNSFDLIVTAENGRTTTYKVVVNRKEYNVLSDLEEITNKKLDADIVIDKDSKLTKNDLNKIVKAKNKIVLKFTSDNKTIYEWVLDGKKIKTVDEFIPYIDMNIKDNEDMKKALNYPEGIYLDFRNCKDIPKGVILKYNVSDKYADGDKINIYIYDEKEKEVIELKNNLKVEDGYVEFEISNSLRHVITKSSINNAAPTKTNNINIFLIVSIILFIIVLILIALLIKSKSTKKLNDVVVEVLEEVDKNSEVL